jgi:hypothetical protein
VKPFFYYDPGTLSPFPGHLPGSPSLERSPWVLLQFPHDATVASLCGVTHFRSESALVH